MIEVFEGEKSVILLVPEASTDVSAEYRRLMFLDDGTEEVESAPLDVTVSDVVELGQKEVEIDISDISQWPTPFDVYMTYTIDSQEEAVKVEYSVVTPYASPESIVVSGGFTTTDTYSAGYREYASVREMESLARHVINSQTRQNFGRSYKKVIVEGTDVDQLYLDEEASWIGAVLCNGEPIYPDGAATYSLSASGHGLSIREEDGVKCGFPSGYTYEVIGIFGPKFVPFDITLAAKQLAVHYLCSDAAQVNRYIESIKFGESAQKVSSKAFTGTGLFAVDRLLEPYVAHRYIVI